MESIMRLIDEVDVTVDSATARITKYRGPAGTKHMPEQPHPSGIREQRANGPRALVSQPLHGSRPELAATTPYERNTNARIHPAFTCWLQGVAELQAPQVFIFVTGARKTK